MYSMKTISYTKQAIKVLRKAPENVSSTIRAKIKAYAADPASQKNNVKRLHGRSGFRLRVGDWRVIFDEHGTVLMILHVGPRGSIY